MRRSLIIVLCLYFSSAAFASGQQVWWVYFCDKSGSQFDAYSFFDPAAIERREKNGISLLDVSDFPVSSSYLEQVGELVDTLGYASRWLNAVSVVATGDQIVEVEKLSFVSNVVLQKGFEWESATRSSQYGARPPALLPQVTRMQGQLFSDHQITGRGVNIAILDAGFWGVDSHEAFLGMRFNNQIRKTWNFMHNDSAIYGEKSDHGTMVLSCIAGKTKTQVMGTATEANFLLGVIAKEYGNQYRAEERYIAGVEWADRGGAHIINISGGPNENAYFPEDMDGHTSIMSFACKMAARKGILVVAAAGNNGDKMDRQLLPPAETDSVLSVTALGDLGFIASYSSIGPPPDFRRKPDICAPGSVFVAAHDKNGDEYADSDGTSFSAPLATGFAACLMQLYPSINAMGTIDSMRKCAHLYPYYDYSHGYGVPQAGYFYRDSSYLTQSSFVFIKSDTSVVVELTRSADTLIDKLASRLLFWNLTDESGRIVEYNVIEVNSPIPINLNYSKFDRSSRLKLCVWYKEQYAETDF